MTQWAEWRAEWVTLPSMVSFTDSFERENAEVTTGTAPARERST
jgi:hypothetical protein